MTKEKEWKVPEHKPFIERKFKIVSDKNLYRKGVKCGVYYLNIGTHFYIGRSVDINRRSKQYKSEVEKLFRLYGNNPSDIPTNHYLYKLFNLLIQRTDINYLNFSLVEQCTPDKIMEVEHKWLQEASNFDTCLNMGFESNPSSGDTKKKNIQDAG